MKKCKKCGANNFWITESYGYRNCEIDEDGTLGIQSSKADGGIDNIQCGECQEWYGESDFTDINFG